MDTLDISSITRELKEEIERKRTLVVEWNHQGVKGSLQLSLFTQMVDSILRRLFYALFKSGYPDYSIVALGGYGRKEMGLYSDVDIMFLYTGKGFRREEQVGAIVQALWDMGLHVGHSYRSVNEAIKLMEEDSTIRMSFLDARLIGGSLNPYLRFKNMLPGGLKGKKKREFLQELMEWMEERHDKFGSSMYLLEPNVKESPGGLRDVHTVLWAAKVVYGSTTIRDLKRKGLLTPLEFEILSNSLDFLWRVRNEIHARRERKSDTLSLDIQEFAAEHLGYRSTRRLSAVELFMRDYYASVAAIRRIARAFLLRTMEEMELAPFRLWEVKTLMEILERRYDTPAHFLADVHKLQLQGVNFDVIPKSFWIPPLSWREEDYRTAGVRESLNLILSSPNAYSTLRFLHEVGFLGRIFPLWERLRGLMQFDIYHRYTVDEHSLLSIRFYEELERGGNGAPQELLAVCKAVPPEMRRLLLLSLLLHDIGKGRGGGHSVRGARIATDMLQALGYPEEEIEVVQFLVRHHTTLYQTALRRDPTDPNSLKELANTCRNPLALDMLLLVTYGDLKAVGPDVWTDWKANIILETYQRARDYLERGDEALSRPEEKRGVDGLSQRLVEKLKGRFSQEQIADVLAKMPEKYLAQVSIRHMAVHIPPMIEARASRGYSITFAPYPGEGYTEMALCKRDVVGDFANIVGVLSLNRVNVLSAWLFLCSDSYALDVFHITDSRFRYQIGERTIKKIEEDLGAIFSGETTIEELLKKKPSLLSQKYSTLKVPTKITLDNDTSETHSIIDIKALDRMGLLYDIASTLTKEGLSIEATRITTEGNKAVDAFYVVDSHGSKLTHTRFMDLARKLKQAIEHED